MKTKFPTLIFYRENPAVLFEQKFTKKYLISFEIDVYSVIIKKRVRKNIVLCRYFFAKYRQNSIYAITTCFGEL